MTQNELLYVKAVTEHRSITKAAASLYISQPSLSQALQRIENNIGTALFQRAGNGLILTHAGKLYYEAAVKILKIYSDTVRRIEEYTIGKSGSLHMGISPQFGQYVLPSILPRFCQKFPNIDTNITEAASHILTEKLLTGVCDFAILNCAENDFLPQFNYDVVITRPFVLVANKQDVISELAVDDPAYQFPLIDPACLQNKTFIMIHPGHRVRKVADQILTQAHITQPSIPFSVENMQTAYTLVSNGMGLSFSPTQFATTMSPQNVSFFSIPDHYNTLWSTCITTIRGGHLSPAALGFIDFVKEFFADN